MADAAPGSAAGTAVAQAVMTPDPGAAVPIAQVQRRKLSDLSRMINEGGLDNADPAALPSRQTQQVEDAPLFSGGDEDPAELELRDPALETPAAIERDDSTQAEVVDPAEYEKIRQMMDAPELAEPMLDKLVTATVHGKQIQVTVRDAIKAYQYDADYSQKMAALAQERRNVQQARQGLEKLLTDMDDAEGFLNAMRVLGKWGTQPADKFTRGTGFLGAAMIVGEQMAQEYLLRQKNPEAYEQLMRERKQSELAWRMQQENAQLRAALQAQQTQQAQQPDAGAQQIVKQLEQLVPAAIKHAGIPELLARDPMFKLEWDANSDRIYELHWQNLLNALPDGALDGGPTIEFVSRVVNATKQTIQQRAERIGTPVQNASLPPAGQRLAGAPAPNGQPGGNGVPKRMQIRDMGKYLGRT